MKIARRSQASLLVFIGAITLLAQVIVLRELTVAFFGIELIYLLAIGGWLWWSAIGALVGKKRWTAGGGKLRWLLLTFAILLPADVILIRSLRVVSGGVTGAYLSLPLQLAALLLALLPLGMLSGTLFQGAARSYVQQGGSLAQAYGIESGGGIIGGILATAGLHFGAANLTQALACSMLALIALLIVPRQPRSRPLVISSLAFAGGLCAALIYGRSIDFRTAAWNHPHLVDVEDTPYGRIAITELEEQVAVFDNDALAFETQSTAAEEFVHLAALQCEHPAKILVLGGGVEGLVTEALKHHPEQVDYVELNRELLRMTTPHLPVADQLALKSPLVRVVFGDPRAHIPGDQRYDLILVGMPEPDSAQNNRFYTQDFFEQLATRLQFEGIAAFRLKSAENLWTPQLVRRTAGIVHALENVFPSVIVLPGVTNVILASPHVVSRDTDKLIERFTARGITAQLVSASYITYLYTNDRFAEIRQLISSGLVPPNLDEQPVCFQLTEMIWLSQFVPALAQMDWNRIFLQTSRSHAFWLFLCVGIATAMGILRRRPERRAVGLAAVTGFAGMTIELVLLLNYQIKRGVLYENVGLLLTMFMAGLSGGALLADRWLRSAWSEGRTADRDRGSEPDEGGAKPDDCEAAGSENRLAAGDHRVALSESGSTCNESRSAAWRGRSMLLGLALFSLVVMSLLRAGGGLAATSAELLVAGFMAAGVFTFATVQTRHAPTATISSLYAADLLGGCVGSLLTSFVLVPLLGLVNTLVIVVLLVAGALLLI